MRFAWQQRTRTHGSDPELFFLGVSGGGCFALASWLALQLPTPRCAFHALTGLPCLTCGATRAAIQFLHGHFEASALYNPLAFAAYCGIALFNVYAAIVLLTGAPRLRLTSFSVSQKRLLRVAAVTLLAANWAYLLIARPV